MTPGAMSFKCKMSNQDTGFTGSLNNPGPILSARAGVLEAASWPHSSLGNLFSAGLFLPQIQVDALFFFLRIMLLTLTLEGLAISEVGDEILIYIL